MPFPLGGLAFALAAFLGYLYSIFYKKEYKSLLSPRQVTCFIGFAVFPFLIYTILVSGLALSRVAQLLLPLLALCVLTVPQSASSQKLFAGATLFGGGAFFSVHIFFLVFSNADVFSVDHIDFSFVYGYLIYQSLVTYPAVLSLYFFCALGMFLSSRYSAVAKLVLIFYMGGVFFLLLIASRRVSILEIVGGLLIILSVTVLMSLLRNKVRISAIFMFMFLVCILPLVFYYIQGSPLYERATSSYSSGTFDSGRLAIYEAALDYFMGHPTTLFFGAGGEGAVGYHNFFLDTVYRIGLLGLLLYFCMLVYLVKKYIAFSRLSVIESSVKSAMLAVLVYLLLVQTFVNTSITQPYYALNYLAALLLVQFYLFRKRDDFPVGDQVASGVTRFYEKR